MTFQFIVGKGYMLAIKQKRMKMSLSDKIEQAKRIAQALVKFIECFLQRKFNHFDS